MKRTSLLSPLGITGIAATAIALALMVTGCKHLTGPPAAWEQRYYDITTNTIEMVNWSTNTVTLTNIQEVIVQKEVPGTTNFVTITNLVPVLAYQTNVVLQTNIVDESYTYKPNQRARDEIVGRAGDVGGLVGPIGGQVAPAIAGIALALWGALRSRKNKKTAEVLAHEVQVGREIIRSTPALAGFDPKYKNWLRKHQNETNTFKDVVNVLKKTPDSEEARKAAKEIATS